MWRVIPGDDLFIRRGSENYLCIPSGGPAIGGSVPTDLAIPVSGEATIGGTTAYLAETVAIGTLVVEGEAIRADEATITPVGGCVISGEAAREGESVLVPVGGMVVTGYVPVQYAFHYGWWASDGFWPNTIGWWWDAYWEYEQQESD